MDSLNYSKCSKSLYALATLFALTLATSPLFAQVEAADDSASPTTLAANDDAQSRSQIRAATWDALHTLRADIESRSIDANLTVANFIATTQSKSEWNTSLRRRAEQIGGPRWIDAETCQVRMEIDGDRVATALIEIAAAHPDVSPLPREALADKLSQWSRRLFSATGTSLRADRAIDIRPESAAWSGVDDASRQRTIAAARDAAINRILDIVRNVSLSDSKTFGALLIEHPETEHALRAWLTNQPATAVRFGDNLEVSYAISLTGDDLLDRTIAEFVMANVALSNGSKIEDARSAFRTALGDTAMVGHSNVGSVAAIGASGTSIGSNGDTTTSSNTTTRTSTSPLAPSPANRGASASVILPPSPPAWAFRQISAEATASPSGNALRTREAAEDHATQSIREKLSDFSLNGTTSVGDAAKTSPQVKRALERAIRRARVYHVDYFPDGSVGVKMSLDARDFWFSLERN